MNANMSIYCIL